MMASAELWAEKSKALSLRLGVLKHCLKESILGNVFISNFDEKRLKMGLTNVILYDLRIMTRTLV